MKLTLFFLLFSLNTWARPLVLVAYFDAFGKAPFNNSTRVALELERLLGNRSDLEIKLCPLNTVFDKSFYQIEDCFKALDRAPELVLGLGESNCNFKIETMARNLDKTKGPDNEGNERNNQVIIPGAPSELGFTYPLGSMYCAIPESDRKQIEVSNNAGSFVCNNLAYQFTERYETEKFGFIHVPSHNCKNLEAKTATAVKNLAAMIPSALNTEDVSRLATRKKELEAQREASKNDKCLNEFYKRTKGIDEKGFWSFL